MIARIAAAAARGMLVTLLIAMPSLILSQVASSTPEMVVLLSLLGGALVFSEYNSNFPSFVEFRDAPPLNRTRFVALLITVSGVSLIARHAHDPNGLTALFHGIGFKLGMALDFAFSPVRMMTLALPETAPGGLLASVRAAAGLAFSLAVCAVIFVAVAIRALDWPLSGGSFNVWTNMPLFDPTTGGDVVRRMHRDGWLNICFAILLPFAIPNCIRLLDIFWGPSTLMHPLMMTWLVALWACLPASMAMRGLAILRVADLIAMQRRRTYAASENLQII